MPATEFPATISKDSRAHQVIALCRVLDALEESRYLGSTIVVLWGDHGYHLGQKNHIAKSALWQPATRTPLIIHVPDYIRYRDGGEELYDMQEDPNQWRNLAESPTHSAVKQELIEWLPKTNAEHFRSESK
jgi:arylsulfatase A-like enzyme